MVASHRISSSNFRILPGFLGATLSTNQVLPQTELDIRVLSAKTDHFGIEIPPQTWQRDRDPYYLWEPPAGGLDIAGYSYAVDGPPDDTIDTTATSFDVASSTITQLSDGTHVVAEATWRLLRLAVRALAASLIGTEEVDD